MLSQFCIRRPIFATVLSIIIVLAGLIALRVLPLSQYPDISPPTVRISTTYDGADAQTLARTVAAPIEDQLSGITGLLYYTTNIRSNGDMSISCVFDVGTDANDAMLEINNRVRTAERRLPDVVRNQGVSVRKRSEENLLMVALFSPDGSMAATDLADYANLNIVDELKRLPGIGDVSVFGNAQSAMRIWLDPEKMGLMGITIKDVENAIEAQNAQRSAGRVGTAPTVSEQQLYYTITTPGQLLTAEEFADIIVKADGPDKLVRMKDIATTEIGKRSYEFRVDINGTQGVNVGVYLQTGANAMAAAEAVKARIVELAAQFPRKQDRLHHHRRHVDLRGRLPQRGLPHAVRGRHPRAPRRLRLPAELARHAHPDARSARVAHRHDGGPLALRLLAQHADALRDDALDRHRGRRCHRRA